MSQIQSAIERREKREKILSIILKMNENIDLTALINDKLNQVYSIGKRIGRMPHIEPLTAQFWDNQMDRLSQLYQLLLPGAPALRVWLQNANLAPELFDELSEDFEFALLAIEGMVNLSLEAPQGVHQMDINVLNQLMDFINDFKLNNLLIEFQVNGN